MKFERDPRDRRYPERLAGSTLASLIIHALLAILLFSVLASSSQQGANENLQGGEVITLERRAPVVNQPSATHAVLPIPHPPRIAPIAHAPLTQPQTQRLPQNRHELARNVLKAPPNPRPIPQQSPQPNPQPTQVVLEVQPRNEIPAAPVTVPTVAPQSISLKRPPTAAPSPAPTSAPTARPSPKAPAPTAAPTARPATPAPARPSASPTAAAIALRSSPAPSPGVASPSPVRAPSAPKTTGTAPSPGPAGKASPGPRPGLGKERQPSPPRPVQIAPTPSPAPRKTAAPSQNNLNAKLRALLPNNPVHPEMKQYVPNLARRMSVQPTPPPQILAETKYIYESSGTGDDARTKMWVISAHKRGPTTICTGWLVRFPQPARMVAQLPNNVHIGPANGTQISVGGAGGGSGSMGTFAAGLDPIVVGMVTEACNGRRLVPFAASAAPSP